MKILKNNLAQSFLSKGKISTPFMLYFFSESFSIKVRKKENDRRHGWPLERRWKILKKRSKCAKNTFKTVEKKSLCGIKPSRIMFSSYLMIKRWKCPFPHFIKSGKLSSQFSRGGVQRPWWKHHRGGQNNNKNTYKYTNKN